MGKSTLLKRLRKRKIDMIPYNIRIALSKEDINEISSYFSCNSYL